MQRKRTLIGLLLAACISLSACGGQALNLDAGKAITSSSPAATTENFDPPVPSPSPPASTVDSSPDVSAIAVVPEQPAAPVESSGATASASEVPPPVPAEPTAAPTTNPEFANVQLPSPEDRWRYIQADRVVLPNVTTYTTPSKQILWWYDPIFGQPIALGQIQGDFQVQATFRLRGQEVDALEVPYQINNSYGIRLPSATVERMKAAGMGEWAETYVFKTDDIRPR